MLKVSQLMLSLFATSIFIISSRPAFADCQSDSNKAMLLLTQVKQQALSNQSVNQDQFKAELEPVMQRLQHGNCMGELMALMHFIQTEQQRYPAPASLKKAK